jgi:AcrR family transcriptional regulator
VTVKKSPMEELSASAELREGQRGKIIQATYRTIAEKGFEGLRMREIAARAGLNHSTLHYYFAGKEALISGLMDYMVQELSLGREKSRLGAQVAPREELASHFDALVHQAREHPEMFIVLTELHARSTRDPEVRAVMRSNERIWKGYIADILRRGIRSGDFDAKLNAEATTDTILALIRGLNTGSLTSLARAGHNLRQLVSWLTRI